MLFKKSKLEKFFDELNKKLFPDGEKQHKEEAQEIMKLSNGKLNFDESLNLLLGTSALFSIAEDRSEERIIEYINKKTNQKLNSEETKRILSFIVSKFYGSVDILQLLINKARGLKQEGKLQKALACYNDIFNLLAKKADEYARNSEETVIDNGKVRTVMPKFFDEAKKYLKRDKTAALISNNMGVILAELGDFEGARKMFKQAIDLTPDKVDYADPKTNLKKLEN